MRSAKRYSNVTFTRRVDHDAGRHRSGGAPAEPRVCRECGAVYSRRRWFAATSERAKVLAPVAHPARCPACEMAAKRLARGYLTLEGGFLTAHRQEIEMLIRNEAARAAEDNPTARILSWNSGPDALTVTTSTEHLTQRLGHAVHKAFGGEIDYGFSHENKLARATWRRD